MLEHIEPIGVDGVLDEIYFGVNKDVEELIDIVHRARARHLSKFEGEPADAERYPIGCNTDPEWTEFVEKLRSMFGIIFSVNIYKSKWPNASTMPIIYKIGVPNISEKIKATSNGWKVDPSVKYCSSMNISSNFIYNDMYTDRELVAAILHEVGHSFVEMQKKICPAVESVRSSLVASIIIMYINAILFDLSAILLSVGGGINIDVHNMAKNNANNKPSRSPEKMIHGFNAHIPVVIPFNTFLVWLRTKELFNKSAAKAILRQNKYKTTAIARVLNTTSDKVASIFDKVNKYNPLTFAIRFLASLVFDASGFNAFDRFTTAKAYEPYVTGDGRITSLHNRQKENNALGRSMEYLADSFAASYGLGNELQSGLAKLDVHMSKMPLRQGINKVMYEINPLNAKLDQFSSEILYKVNTLLDEHPVNGERYKKLRDDLKEELKDPRYPKELKQEIMQTIEAVDEAIVAIEDGKANPQFDGKDYRAMFHALLTSNGDLGRTEKSYTNLKDRNAKYDSVVNKEAVEAFEPLYAMIKESYELAATPVDEAWDANEFE